MKSTFGVVFTKLKQIPPYILFYRQKRPFQVPNLNGMMTQ